MVTENDILADRPMNVSELMKYLRISRAVALRLLNTGAIAARKVGRSWRIQRAAVDAYLAQPDKVKKVRK